MALIAVQRAPERLQMRAVNCHKGGPSLLPLLSVALCALLPRVPFCASPSRSLCRFLALQSLLVSPLSVYALVELRISTWCESELRFLCMCGSVFLTTIEGQVRGGACSVLLVF